MASHCAGRPRGPPPSRSPPPAEVVGALMWSPPTTTPAASPSVRCPARARTAREARTPPPSNWPPPSISASCCSTRCFPPTPGSPPGSWPPTSVPAARTGSCAFGAIRRRCTPGSRRCPGPTCPRPAGCARSATAASRPAPSPVIDLAGSSDGHGEFFPAARQALKIIRRRRGRRGRWSVQTLYAITSLDSRDADPALLATWVRGHWGIEAGLHWVRDVTFGEDHSQVRTDNGPINLAALRTLAINALRLTGHSNIAAGLREHARTPLLPLATLGLM